MIEKKMTLKEYVDKYKPNYGELENRAGIPTGTLAQYMHKRRHNPETLDKITYAIHSQGKEQSNIKIVP